jgi:hypothetical protein
MKIDQNDQGDKGAVQPERAQWTHQVREDTLLSESGSQAQGKTVERHWSNIMAGWLKE